MTTDRELDRDLADLARRLDRDLDPTAADRVLVGLLTRAPAPGADPVTSTETVLVGPVDLASRRRPRRRLAVAASVAAAVVLVAGGALVVRSADDTDRGTGPATVAMSASPTPSVTGNGRVLDITRAQISAGTDALNADLAARGFRVAFLPSPNMEKSENDPPWTCDEPSTEAPYQQQVFGPVSQDNAAPIVLYPDLLPPDTYLVFGVSRGGTDGGMMFINFIKGPLPSCIY